MLKQFFTDAQTKPQTYQNPCFKCKILFPWKHNPYEFNFCEIFDLLG